MKKQKKSEKLQVFVNKEKIRKIVILFFCFLFSFVLYFSFFTNKLNDEEYSKIKSLYTEINYVDTTGSSNFYVNNFIKVLDKQTVLSNLRKDSLKYSLIVSQNMITMLSEGKDTKSVQNYISRCNLDFSEFNGLSVNDALFDLYVKFLNDYNVATLDLESFWNDLYSIVSEEQNDLASIRVTNILILSGYCLLYILIGCFWFRHSKYKKGVNL